MHEERLTKRAWKTEEVGIRRGRPRLRWRNSIGKDPERTGEQPKVGESNIMIKTFCGDRNVVPPLE